MQGDNMKDKDVDKYLSQHLSGSPPREAFKQQTLRDSTVALVRVQRRRSAWRRAELAAAEPDGVNVPSHLVAWLDAARLFGQLGMEDRMGRAVERAGRLLPFDAVTTSSMTGQTLAATGDEVIKDQSKNLILADILYPPESVVSISGITAQSFGGNYNASKMD
jgi:hypothetical protein